MSWLVGLVGAHSGVTILLGYGAHSVGIRFIFKVWNCRWFVPCFFLHLLDPVDRSEFLDDGLSIDLEGGLSVDPTEDLPITKFSILAGSM